MVTEPNEVTLHLPRTTEQGPKNPPVIVSQSLYVQVQYYVTTCINCRRYFTTNAPIKPYATTVTYLPISYLMTV